MDQMSTCPLCNFPGKSAGLCNRCQSRIHRQLDDLWELWSKAHDELLPGKGGHGSSSSERSIGLSVSALSFIAGHDILGLLHEWEKFIREELKLTPPALVKKPPSLSAEIGDAIKFAQVHLPWLGTQELIDDFAKELRDLHSQGMTAARQFLKKTRRIACPGETSEGICNTLLAINDEDPLELFECRGCKTTWSTLRLVAVALSDPNRQVWLDAEAIGNWIGVSERHVHRLARKHKIIKRGQLYDVNGLKDAYDRDRAI